jgi:flagellar assembly protein FliH
MTALERFLFDYDFDAEVEAERQPAAPPDPREEPGAPCEPEALPAQYTEADLEAARAESYQAGYDLGIDTGRSQGREEAETESTEAARAALSQVAQQLESLVGALDDTEARRDREALELAIAVTRRLFPELQRREGLREIETLVTDTLQRLRETPLVVIRAGGATLSVLQERKETLAELTGFEGKLRVIEDDTLDPADVRVEWSDGTAERDTDGLWRQIDRAIANALGETPTAAAANGGGSASTADTRTDGAKAPQRSDKEANMRADAGAGAARSSA